MAASDNGHIQPVSEQIGQKIELLMDNPDQISTLSEEVGQLLRTCTAKRQLFEVTKKCYEKCLILDRPNLILLGKFLSNIIGTTIVCAESGKLCSFKDALCSCVSQPVTLTQEAFEAFRRKLPFMNELFRLHLVQWGAIKVLLSGIQESDEISIRYLFEIVKNTDRLVDEHIASIPKVNTDPYWCSLVTRLKQAFDDRVVTDQSVLNDMFAFFQSLKHKHRWCASLMTHSDKKRKSCKSESDSLPSAKRYSPLPESQATTPIGRIMDILSKDEHYLKIATSKLKALLSNSPTSVAFLDSVFELLNAIYAADQRLFPACIELLESMRDISVNDVTFSQAVSRCTAAKNSFDTAEQIDRFCASFRLTNELFRIGLVPSDLFQSYAANLTNGDSELSMVLLYRVVRNVEKLVETGYAKLTYDEVNFWTRQNLRLSGALQRNLFKSRKTVTDIAEFLKVFEMKGGWDVSPVESKLDLELINMISSMALVGNFKTWLWPLIAKFQSISSPCHFSEALNQFLVKMSELIVDEVTLNEAGEICQLLINTDFCRGNNFLTELKQFCLNFLSGQEATESQEHIRLNSANPSLEKMLYLLMKRRQGCTRLVGHLYLAQVFDTDYLVSLCNALLASQTFPALECLFWLFTDIGCQFSSVILEKGLASWWTKFFEEIGQILQNPSSPSEVKRLAKAILVEKGQWPTLDAKTRARENLSKLLSELSPDLRNGSPGEFNGLMQQVRDLLAKEVPDHHTQQMFEILLTKIDSTFKESSVANTPSPPNPTPVPSASHD